MEERSYDYTEHYVYIRIRYEKKRKKRKNQEKKQNSVDLIWDETNGVQYSLIHEEIYTRFITSDTDLGCSPATFICEGSGQWASRAAAMEVYRSNIKSTTHGDSKSSSGIHQAGIENASTLP
jgi:predicted ATPase